MCVYVCVCSFRVFEQHDPDDEPVAPPLDPEFFEFDRQSPRSQLIYLRRVITESPLLPI